MKGFRLPNSRKYQAPLPVIWTLTIAYTFVMMMA
jgi:hypothetical protein